jgi:ABC-type transporter Mla maintaining outer membrane lipid asymmetry permease subunit MlaE
MNQTRLESLIEQFVNMFFKFWVAAACWKFLVAPLITAGVLSYQESIPITIIFTVLSLIQGYFWRRVFNGIHLHSVVHRLVTAWRS